MASTLTHPRRLRPEAAGGGRFVRRAMMTLAALAVLSVPAMLAMKVRLGVSVYNLGAEVESLKKQRDALVKSNGAYQIEVASLASPERVEALATSLIGMTSPADNQIVIVRRVARGASRPAPPTAQATAGPRGPGRS